MKRFSPARLLVVFAIGLLCCNSASFAQGDLQDGEVAIKQGNFNAAIDLFTFKLNVDPNNAAAHTGRAIAYLGKGDTENARSDLDEAIRLNPKAVAAYVGRARLHLGLNDNDKAIADASKVIELNRKSSDGYSLRAAARLRPAAGPLVASN